MNDPINDDNFNFTEQREAQLTAYALGELDEHERALVERRLEHDADARAIVTQVRELATMLTAELAAEPMPRLSEPQREALRAEHPVRVNGVLKARTVPLRTRLWFGVGLAAAACLAIAVTTFNLDDSSRQSVREPASAQPMPQVHMDVQGRGQVAGQDSRASKLYAFGKELNEEQMGLNRQADAKVKLGVADKLASAETAAGAAPIPGTSKGEVFRAPLQDARQLTDQDPESQPTSDLSSTQLGQELAMQESEARSLQQPAPSEAGSTSAVTGSLPPPPLPARSPLAGSGGAADQSFRLRISGRRLAEGSGAGGGIPADMNGDPGYLPWSRGDAPASAAPPNPMVSRSVARDLFNGAQDAQFDQTSISVADLPERIAGAKQDLLIVENEIAATAQKLEGIAAAGNVERTKRINELESLRNTIRQFISELEVERDRCEALRRQQPNTETYNRIVDNPFLAVTENPLSTFSIDVDTGSYANVRRFLLQNNTLPPPDAVRIEELINYFPLAAVAPGPESEHPFAVHVDMWEAPWNGVNHLARITIKGREVKMDQRPATSLVFLIDVSGSMQPANKLPLLKQSMKMLVDQLHGDDRIAIVTYAGASGLALPSTFASDKQRILGAIDNLNAGGSTNGAAGIQLAYQVAAESFIPGGVNRVILATDGDFNVGVSDDASLIRLIEEKRTTGVHLSVLGFGAGNLKDAKMEQLANHGNGEYAYIDSAREGRKVLVEQAAGTLITIAKDVKIQIEFNPATVASYRLIGYENRVLAKEDFNNDAKDAGEIGAGHCVTALYEIVSANADVAGVPAVDALKYQKPVVQPTDAAKNSGELMTVKLRYKQPDGQISKLIEMPVPDMRGRLGWVPDDLRFLTAVAEFGMLLRNSPYKGNANFAQVLELAEGARGEDVSGYRAEFINLVNRAKALRGQ